MRATTFRNIALGILALAFAYHLGVRSAGAQAGTTVECASVQIVNSIHEDFAVINRFVYVLGTVGGTQLTCTAPVPGTSPIIACGPNDVVLANGDVFQSNATAWTLIGHFPAGTTPVQRQTFGSVKARYR